MVIGTYGEYSYYVLGFSSESATLVSGKTLRKLSGRNSSRRVLGRYFSKIDSNRKRRRVFLRCVFRRVKRRLFSVRGDRKRVSSAESRHLRPYDRSQQKMLYLQLRFPEEIVHSDFEFYAIRRSTLLITVFVSQPMPLGAKTCNIYPVVVSHGHYTIL